VVYELHEPKLRTAGPNLISLDDKLTKGLLKNKVSTCK